MYDPTFAAVYAVIGTAACGVITLAAVAALYLGIRAIRRHIRRRRNRHWVRDLRAAERPLVPSREPSNRATGHATPGPHKDGRATVPTGADDPRISAPVGTDQRIRLDLGGHPA